MSQPIRGQGGHLVFLIGSKNTNLVEGVEILLSVKFRWILFSGFRGEVENVKVYAGRTTDDGRRTSDILKIEISKVPFTPKSRLTRLSPVLEKMDGSVMSEPWSGRAYVGPKYSGDQSCPLKEVVVSWISFSTDWKIVGMTPLSPGRMLRGGTVWWSAVQRRLVLFWSDLVGDTA